MELNIGNRIGWTAEELLAAGVAQAEIDAVIATNESLLGRSAIRAEINKTAGDSLSLLGTAADAAALGTLGVAVLTVAVDQATSWGSFKTAYMAALGQLAGDQDMVQISQSFLGKIASGEVVIPLIEKGISEVMADIEQRSTAVSGAISTT